MSSLSEFPWKVSQFSWHDLANFAYIISLHIYLSILLSHNNIWSAWILIRTEHQNWLWKAWIETDAMVQFLCSQQVILVVGYVGHCCKQQQSDILINLAKYYTWAGTYCLMIWCFMFRHVVPELVAGSPEITLMQDGNFKPRSAVWLMCQTL
jgi:hypothetical protein